jgi:ribosome-associated protein YbcJ (S4-like RNA binding protein)
MNLVQFLNSLDDSSQVVEFSDSMELIDSLYKFTPTAFRNGNVENSADQNHGSCKILSFARLQQLDKLQTLRCFGAFYQSVLDSPSGDDHQNIRQFDLNGWDGVVFEGDALAAFSNTTTSDGINSMDKPANIVAKLEAEFAELYKILKFEGLAHSGGFAKQVIADGQVRVNGEVETRKRKKIVAGDNIEFDGQGIDVTSKSD